MLTNQRKTLLFCSIFVLLSLFTVAACPDNNENSICSHSSGDVVNAGESFTIKWNRTKTIDCIKLEVTMAGPGAASDPGMYSINHTYQESWDLGTTPYKSNSIYVPCDVTGLITVKVTWRKWSWGGGNCKTEEATETIVLTVASSAKATPSYHSTFCEPGTYTLKPGNLDTINYNLNWYDNGGSIIHTGYTYTDNFSLNTELLLKYSPKTQLKCGAANVYGVYVVNVLPAPMVFRTDVLVDEDASGHCRQLNTYANLDLANLNQLTSELNTSLSTNQVPGISLSVNSVARSYWTPIDKISQVQDIPNGPTFIRACEVALRQDNRTVRSYYEYTDYQYNKEIDENIYSGMPTYSLSTYGQCTALTNWLRIRKFILDTNEPIDSIVAAHKGILQADSSREAKCTASEVMGAVAGDTLLLGPKAILNRVPVSVQWVPNTGLLQDDELNVYAVYDSIPMDEFDSNAFTYTAYITEVNTGIVHTWCSRIIKGEKYTGARGNVQTKTANASALEFEPVIYPNPAFKTINLSQVADYNLVQVINVQGQVKIEKPLMMAAEVLDIAQLPAGYYIVRFMGDAEYNTQTLIVTK